MWVWRSAKWYRGKNLVLQYVCNDSSSVTEIAEAHFLPRHGELLTLLFRHTQVFFAHRDDPHEGKEVCGEICSENEKLGKHVAVN